MLQVIESEARHQQRNWVPALICGRRLLAERHERASKEDDYEANEECDTSYRGAVSSEPLCPIHRRPRVVGRRLFLRRLRRNDRLWRIADPFRGATYGPTADLTCWVGTPHFQFFPRVRLLSRSAVK